MAPREWIHSLKLRWKMAHKRRQLDRDLDEELAFHREMRASKFRALGEAPEEARYHAERRFGNATLTKETVREAWSLGWLEEIWRDVLHAVRALRRTPGFTLIAVATLAIGIGANTSVFTGMNALFLRSLPVRNPQELRVLNLGYRDRLPSAGTAGYGNRAGDGTRQSSSVSYPMFQRFLENQRGFRSLAGFAQVRTNAAARGQATAVRAQLVTANFFDTMGVTPVLGRGLLPEEDRPEAPPVAVISARLWEKLYGADPAALGSKIEIERVPYTVVGILPARFIGLWPGEYTDVYMALTRAPKFLPFFELNHPDRFWVQTIGRLAPGVNEAVVRAPLNLVLQQHTEDFNRNRAGRQKRNTPWIVLQKGGSGLAFVQREAAMFLNILLGMVGLVLLIACANVANLLIARGTARARELAIRQSLGAGRWRVVRHLMIEALLIATAGGALGLFLAQFGTAVLAHLLNDSGNESALDLSADVRVLLFTAALSIATALVAGIAPALRSTVRADAASCLKQAGALAGGLRQRLANSLVLAQVSMATVLVIAAGLFGRTLLELGKVDLGFRADNLLLFYVDPSRNGHPGDKANLVLERIQQQAGSLPGVSGATMSAAPLLAHSIWNTSFDIVGEPKVEPERIANVHLVGDRFLTVLGTPLLLGRDLDASDTKGAPMVGVVNQALVKKYFGGGNPIGREIKSGHWSAFRIVGVAADAKYDSIRGQAPPTFYIPFRQQEHEPFGMTFEVRTAVADPLSIVPAVRKIVADIDPTLPVSDIRTQSEQVKRSIAPERTFAILASFFSGVAVLLAAIGLYGVLAYAVSRRTPEFGIRMALGATGHDVRWLAVRSALLVVAAGIAVGIPAALALSQGLRSQLFGVQPVDPVSIVLAATALLAAGVLAAWVPGRRAAKADPATALRYE